LPWAGARLQVSSFLGMHMATGENRACVHSAAIGNAKLPVPDWTPLCHKGWKESDRLMPDCEAEVHDVGVLAAGDAVIAGTFCDHQQPVEIAWWKPKRGLLTIPMPGMPARHGRASVGGEARLALVSENEAYVIAQGTAICVDTPDCTVTSKIRMARCDGKHCEPMAPPPIASLDRYGAKSELVGAADGALFFLHEKTLWRRGDAWVKESLPGEVELAVGLDTAKPHVLVNGKVYVRAAGAWSELPLPRHHGQPLKAMKIVLRKDEVWITACHEGEADCRAGNLLLRRGPKAAVHQCPEIVD
jgi:hypothetical protein